MKNKALINKIINFSNVDGPGNRCAIFFQSCPFKCLYCHNPETINLCVNCGVCVKNCPKQALSLVDGKVIWDKSKCVNCDTCINVCPNLSSPKTELVTVEDLLEVIKENEPFIRGITVSGGECMVYHEFLTELFTEVKKLGLTTFIDSNGYYDFSLYPLLMSVTDKVMLDVKAYDNEFHKELTSKSNEIVLKNLNYLLDNDKMYEVRTVLLNNHKDDNINTVTNVSKIINDRCRYKLIKYRQYGVRKQGLEALGDYTYSDSELEEMVNIAKKYMNNIVIV